MSGKRILSRRGLTLVEVLVAAALLVILIAGIIAVISFSNTLLGKNIVAENAVTQAEGIADVLISALSSGTSDQATLESLADALMVSAFHNTPNARQFKVVEDNHIHEQGLTLEGYWISVQVNDKDGNPAASINAFASKPRSTS